MKKLLLVLLLCQFSVFAQSTIEKYHRAKIIYQTTDNLKILESLGIPMDHGFHKAGYSLTSDFSETEIEIARNLGLEVIIEINDVQKFYVNQNKFANSQSPDNTNCSSNNATYITPTNFNLGTMGGYLTYEQMLQELDDMHTLYPNLISSRDNVGTFLTFENRALQWVKITANVNDPNTKPQVLYTAIHHAREPISLMETIYYMWYLLENYDTNDEIKNIVDNTEMYFIPVINPDGYIYNQTTNPNGGGMWRKNRRDFGDGTFGVDNNRNYDYWINGDSMQSVWNTLGISPDSTGDTYPGTAAFSEPENQAIKYFVENHNFKIAINAHTYSNLFLYPYGYDLNVPSPDDLLFNKISELLVTESGFTNQIASELYATSGSSDDFMYGQTMEHEKILAFTPEIGSSFWPASSEIIPLCNKMLFSNITTAKLVLDYAKIKDKSPEYIGANATFSADFELTKFGLAGNGNYTVSVVPISTNIINVGTPFTITNMQILDSVNSSIEIGLATGTTSGDDIIYELVVDNGSFEERVIVYKKFGQFQNIMTNDCSVIAPNFTTSTTNGWILTTESFVSPTTSITDSPNANYSSNQTKNITTVNPIVVPNSSCYLTFNTKFDLENNYDYVVFQIANNANYNNWTTQCGKYTTLFQGTPSSNIFQAYTGQQNEWVQEQINLSDYQGQSIKYRFRLVTDFGVNDDGFYFDDIALAVIENTTLSNVESNISNFTIYPNPTNSIININTNSDNYNFSIYSLQGQLIINKENNSGFQQINLNSLSSGMYLIEFKSEDYNEIKKLIKK